MHLCVHRWLHGVWLAAVSFYENICGALSLLVKGIVRFRQARIRLLLGQLYIKENLAHVAHYSPLLSIAICSNGERAGVLPLVLSNMLCYIIGVKVFFWPHPDKSAGSRKTMIAAIYNSRGIAPCFTRCICCWLKSTEQLSGTLIQLHNCLAMVQRHMRCMCEPY